MSQELVFINKKKQAVTTSRKLADKFNKRHDLVLRKINNLKQEDKETFTALNIAVSKYTDDSGKSNKEYILNRDAYAFFAMGFTGIKSNKLKIDFINNFNDMESWIKNRIQSSLEYKVMSATLEDARKIQQSMKNKYMT